MAANPPLVESPQGLVPAPYASEWIGLARSGVDIRIDGHPQGPDRWDRRGTIFITNLRMVFVAEVPDAATGLVAYDLPLSYITQHSFHQPILGCNNLKGQCWTVEQGPGQGTSIRWTIYFKKGGVGTFLPLFHSYVRAYAQQRRGSEPPAPAPADVASAPPEETSEPTPPTFLRTALVDPNDPTRVFLTQPVEESDRIKEPPKFSLI
ncbi:hypothetical protein ACKKBF_B12585 [Auxenochlorella protothecoides x Auxenochlorella symbiontica]